MATGQSLVSRALRLIGALPAGESPETVESNDALVTLNAMLDSWRNERLMCYALREQSLTLGAADASYTIGPSGDLDTVRPIAIEKAWVTVDGYDHPVKMIEDEEYAAIGLKTQAGDFPSKANYKPSMPTGTLTVYPVPNTTRTMKLLTRTPVTAIALVDTIALPPGWEDALATNLALRLAPEYEATPSDDVRLMARESKAGIKQANTRPVLIDSGLVPLLGAGHSNILTDE